MKAVPLGTVHCGNVPLVIQEVPVDSTQIQEEDDFKVEIALLGSVAAAGLGEVRALKRLLAQAEARILLRQDQAARARNLTLDL